MTIELVTWQGEHTEQSHTPNYAYFSSSSTFHGLGPIDLDPFSVMIPACSIHLAELILGSPRGLATKMSEERSTFLLELAVGIDWLEIWSV